ncbi:MAG: coproporphyrinogen dehydrogenase HemZ [Clostridia bacterium]|nr:coproporphyrinogen dehydrogenase HemZ [Clostridia bacterium]
MEFEKPWGINYGVRPVKHVLRMREEGLEDSAIRKWLKDEYQISDKKLDLMFLVADNEQPVIKALDKKSIGLYVDIPFCPSKCIYCSFASMSTEKMGKYLKPYLDALYSEIDTTKKIVNDLGLKIESVYFGGGTPTTLSSAQLDDLIGKLEESFDLSYVKEFTVEAGRPDTITEEKLSVLKKHSVGRISVNPQTINEKTLKVIGRRHTKEQFVDAYNMVRKAGFDCINTDIIAGLPGETTDDFKHTVDAVLGLEPENITVHTMSIKRAADIKIYGCDIESAKASDVANMIDYAKETLINSGYYPYYLYRQRNILGDMENTGYSKKGHSGIYNIVMMEEISTVISLGVGAVTKLVKPGLIKRIFNFKDVIEYINRIDELKERKQYIYEFYDC